MRKPIILALAVVIAAFSLAVCIIGGFEARSVDAAARPVYVGAVIQFGGHDWRVLDVQGNRALIITENIIERRPYNVQWEAVTWETSSLRQYLNGEFLQRFAQEDQRRIAETRIANNDNLWYDTPGGNDTTDRIFLLSLEEVDRYFGNSGDYENRRRKIYEGQWPSGRWVSADYGFGFSNANDSDRIARYNNEALWWWLRSPGGISGSAAGVNVGGGVRVSGGVNFDVFGGVRPALWLNL